MGNANATSVPPSDKEPEVEASKRIVDSSHATSKVYSSLKNKLRVSIINKKIEKKHLPYILSVIIFAAIGTWFLRHSLAEETTTNEATTTNEVTTTNINTSSQSAVNAAYWNLWDPAMHIDAGWSGKVSGCIAGSMTATARNAEVNAINFVRRLQHLKPVSASNGVANNNAMKAALIVEANGTPNHHPPAEGPGSTCHTNAGAAVSVLSNLGIDYVVSDPPVDTPVGKLVKGYLDERIPPAINKDLGHRRRLSYPDANVFGIGTTSHASAVQVIKSSVYSLSTSASNPSPNVAWPTEGFFPKQLAPHIWSLTGSRTTTDFSEAAVKVTHEGNIVPINKYVTNPRYGPLPTLAWSMPSQYEKSGGYLVTVSNIKGNGATTRISYKVRFFDPVQ